MKGILEVIVTEVWPNERRAALQFKLVEAATEKVRELLEPVCLWVDDSMSVNCLLCDGVPGLCTVSVIGINESCVVELQGALRESDTWEVRETTDIESVAVGGKVSLDVEILLPGEDQGSCL